jgi:hypothetical protein
MKSISCDIRIEGSDCFKGNDFVLLPDQVYSVVIDYPLSTPYIRKFNTGKNGAGFLRVVREVSKAYQHAYKNDDKYGIWGHDIGDLVLEGIKVNENTKTITLAVGS